MTKNNDPKTQDLTPNTQDPKILVTGGCGFVGSNLVEFLLENTDWNIRILDNLSVGDTKHIKGIASKYDNIELTLPETTQDPTPNTQQPNNPTNNGATQTVTVLQGDIRNDEDVDKTVKGVDAVVNLAAVTGVPISIEKPRETFQINVNGTQNLLEACRQHQVERFVLASSNAAVGDKPPPMHEKMVPEPISPYGASKLSGEALCNSYSESFGLQANSLRFANVYGPYSAHKSSVVMKFLRRARDGNSLKIFGDGHQTRDFIHARDISRGIVLALKSDASGEVFQIGTNEETEILNLARKIQELAADSGLKEPEIIFEKPRSGDIYRNYTDYEKASRRLGFEPSIKMGTGLGSLWDETIDRG